MFTVKHDQTQVDAFPLRPSHSQPSLTKHTTSFNNDTYPTTYATRFGIQLIPM